MTGRVGVVTEREWGIGGIQRFGKHVAPALLDHPEAVELTVDRSSPVYRPTYPFALDYAKRYLTARQIKRKIRAGNVDRVFLTDFRYLMFDPRSCDAQIIPFVQDIIPATSAFATTTADDLPRAAIAHHNVRQIERCERVFCASEHTRQDIETRTQFDGEATVVYQGVDDFPEPSGDSRFAYDLLYVGTTMARKNPRFLRACFEAAERRGYRVAAVTGDDSLPGDQFQGVDEGTLADLYAGSRYYLHPSKQEGFGRPPLEGQRQGTPTLALDVPINREVLGEAGESWLPVATPDDVLAALDSDDGPTAEGAKENAGRFRWDRTREELFEHIFE